MDADQVRRVVGVADMYVSADPADLLITYALGSCLGITIHDPVARVGGLLHVMLPGSAIDREKAKSRPSTYVDTGVPLLFRTAYAAGAKKERLIVTVAGGATTGPSDHFQIGKRNFASLRELFWKNGVMMAAHDVGGTISRTVSLHMGTGDVFVKSNGKTYVLAGQNGGAECHSTY
jgi:chemotaxis protein CheD